MNHKLRKQLKIKIRPLILKHCWKFILIYLPFIALSIIYSILSHASRDLDKIPAFSKGWGLFILSMISIIAMIAYVSMRYSAIGIHFKILDIIRFNGIDKALNFHNNQKLQMPKSKSYGLKSSTTVLREHRIWSVFKVGFFKYLWTVIWAIPALIMSMACITLDAELQMHYYVLILLSPFILLLALPCIIKNNFSYTFSQYIYRDLDNSGRDVNCHGVIGLSKILFNHHKWNYFMLQLSFWDWLLPPAIIATIVAYFLTSSVVVWIIVGTTAFFSMKTVLAPYIKISELTFYQRLITQRAQAGDKIYQEIVKNINEERKHHTFA